MIVRMGFLSAAVAKYRMDNVPPLLQPWFILYGYGVGLAQFAYHCLIHWTCRIRYEGLETLPGRNVIYCVWHGDLQSYFCVFLRHRSHTWMMHPSWYMKPIRVCMRLVGIDRIGLQAAAATVLHDTRALRRADFCRSEQLRRRDPRNRRRALTVHAPAIVG